MDNITMPLTPSNRRCVICGAEIRSNNPRALTCSPECRARHISQARQASVRARWGEEIVGHSVQIRCGKAEAKALRDFAKREGLPMSVAASQAVRAYLDGVGSGVAK